MKCIQNKRTISDLTGGLTFYFEGRAKLYTVVSLYVKFDIVRDSIITS